jgi:hypothetical protein
MATSATLQHQLWALSLNNISNFVVQLPARMRPLAVARAYESLAVAWLTMRNWAAMYHI